uniref:Defective in cullin neddylation 1 domain containing 3 n=1 Tax=Molossus molossus TaxID=27622 RepID=A0A7J8IX58_MOLMO|nr:defective in cullin neddylation 1 domain containing 3 [Molossus molossus]
METVTPAASHTASEVQVTVRNSRQPVASQRGTSSSMGPRRQRLPLRPASCQRPQEMLGGSPSPMPRSLLCRGWKNCSGATRTSGRMQFWKKAWSAFAMTYVWTPRNFECCSWLGSSRLLPCANLPGRSFLMAAKQ